MKNPIPRSIWTVEEPERWVEIIDQRWLPHKRVVNQLTTSHHCYRAILDMEVRGAPLIGTTAAFGMYFALLECKNAGLGFEEFAAKASHLRSSRPTAVNLMWAVDEMLKFIQPNFNNADVLNATWQKAHELMEEDATLCRRIGEHGVALIEEVFKQNGGKTVNILTHCNAGSLACTEWGTATSPIYQAHLKGIPVHVWVDETRPRNQGANLTAWELNEAGVPHSLIVDNAGGHLMQHGQVDLVFVGADRVTRNGDAANKIGTYLKALAANDNNVPFYVCLPSTTIDWELNDGIAQIEIEERSQDEVRYIQGKVDNEVKSVLICPEGTPAFNLGFDVTPARLITGIITERGITNATEQGLRSQFPEKQAV